MDKKGLAQSDLDLLLIEYYKDPLESQLKNRKTNINDDNLIESTTSIIQTHLLILINWIPPIKPLSTTPSFLFLIFFPSPLFLSFLSIKVIFSVSYCSNHTWPNTPLFVSGSTFLKSSLFLSSFLSINTKEINQVVMAANTPNTERTPTQTLF